MPQELGTTDEGLIVGFTQRELAERWSAIVDAMIHAGIPPDVTTIAALMTGTKALVARSGIQTATQRKRQIGFTPETGR